MGICHMGMVQVRVEVGSLVRMAKHNRSSIRGTKVAHTMVVGRCRVHSTYLTCIRECRSRLVECERSDVWAL
jgi:hypothetical protein